MSKFEEYGALNVNSENLPALREAKALNNLAAHCLTMASVDVNKDSTAS